MAAMQVEMAGGELAELAEAAAHRQPRDRCAPQVLEHRAREIAHLDQRHVGQLIVRAHRVLARVARARGNVRDAVRPRDVDALVDRRDIGRARERPHDAGRAEDRQPADDAEARVHRLQRERFAAFDADRHVEAARMAMLGRQCFQVRRHHLARHRVDRRFADRQRQSRARDRADAGPRMKPHAGYGRERDVREDQRAVRDVRIVAGILDRAGFRTVGGGPAELEPHHHALPLRQHDLDRIVRPAREQQPRGGERRRGRATAGRIAEA